MSEKTDKQGEDELIPFSSFLEEIPPTNIKNVQQVALRKVGPNGAYYLIETPDLQLHCDNEACGGKRFFRCLNASESRVNHSRYIDTFLLYQCDNCKKNIKTYALSVIQDDIDSETGKVLKYGEYPTFGPPIPSRVLKLIGPDREFFLKGRRSENQGLGIGSFSYYRRVVENQKSRIISEILRVSERINAPKEMIESLKSAEQETQFSKSIEMIKDAIPESLMIRGHNPITLLHSALSKGIHAKSDEECLELASSIRVILTDLAEKISQALSDDEEIKNAVTKLLNK